MVPFMGEARGVSESEGPRQSAGKGAPALGQSDSEALESWVHTPALGIVNPDCESRCFYAALIL